MIAAEEKRTNPILKALDFADFLVSKFEGIMLALGVIAMTINTIAAVVSRYVFNSAITGFQLFFNDAAFCIRSRHRSH